MDVAFKIEYLSFYHYKLVLRSQLFNNIFVIWLEVVL